MFPVVDNAIKDGKRIGAAVIDRMDALVHEISQIRKEAPLWATQDVISLPYAFAFSPTVDATYQKAFTVPLGEVWEVETSMFTGLQWRLAANIPDGSGGNAFPDAEVWREITSGAGMNEGRTYYPRLRLNPGEYLVYTDTANGAPVRFQFRKVIPNPVPRPAQSSSDNEGRIMRADIAHEEYRDSVPVPSDLPQAS